MRFALNLTLIGITSLSLLLLTNEAGGRSPFLQELQQEAPKKLLFLTHAKRLTCSTAPGALSPYPSTPMASANSWVTGALRTIILKEKFWASNVEDSISKISHTS